MKKKTIMGILSVFIVIILIIGYLVIVDLNQEKKLKQELEEINDLVGDSNSSLEEIEKRLDKTVTKGDYKIVEKAFKNYLKDSFNNVILMIGYLSDERITSILTADNYRIDGPEFLKTKKYIMDTKNGLLECMDTYYEMLTEEKALSYIEGKGLDDYYIDFYKEEIIANIEEEKEDRTLENSINEVVKMLDTTNEIINFLSENAGKWEIIDNSISFSNEEDTKKYNQMLTEIILIDSDNLPFSK